MQGLRLENLDWDAMLDVLVKAELVRTLSPIPPFASDFPVTLFSDMTLALSRSLMRH